MSINFSAFEIGRRALNASQLGIEVTGQNIANVNTPGYSRRRVELVESAYQSIHGFPIGTGVSVAGIHSFRDLFIQGRIQTETGIAGRLTAERDALAPVETALAGSENGGLKNAINAFFGAFRDLEANPTSVPLRAIAVQRGTALANAFHSTQQRLTDIRESIDGQLRSTVEAANKLSDQIATLNGQIRSIEVAGAEASHLRDQRDLAINKLAELTGARSTQNGDGTVTLTLADGRPLVANDIPHTLTVSDTPPFGLASISLDGEPAAFGEGAIAGFQNAINYVGVQLDDLDSLAASIAERVNTLHSSGTDLDGDPGISFFDDTAPPITAANISMNATIVGDPRLVVASPLTQPGQTGTIAGEIANLLTDPNSTAGSRTGSFSSIFGSMIADAGERIASADNALETQAAILAQATAQRDAVSGVSLDEEAINLLQYQKAFEAASRFIRVADEMTQMILSLAG